MATLTISADEAAKQAYELREFYSLLLEDSLDATMLDGTPVLSLALANDPLMRQCYENVFLND